MTLTVWCICYRLMGAVVTAVHFVIDHRRLQVRCVHVSASPLILPNSAPCICVFVLPVFVCLCSPYLCVFAACISGTSTQCSFLCILVCAFRYPSQASLQLFTFLHLYFSPTVLGTVYYVLLVWYFSCLCHHVAFNLISIPGFQNHNPAIKLVYYIGMVSLPWFN